MSELKVKTIEPSTGTNLTLGTSGDTVEVSSDSVKLDIWKDSGGNTLFQSDGSGTLSNINSAFSGSGPKLILSQTADNSATISFTSNIDSTYDHYMFVFTNLNPATDATNFTFQANASGQSGYNESITSTTVRSRHAQDNTFVELGYETGKDQANGTAFQILFSGLGNTSDENCGGILHLWSPSSTTFVKQWYSRIQGKSDYPDSREWYMGGYFNTTSAITEVQFKMASGNFDGKIILYGVS
tara:strand:+ start:141 stop:866 length:726 start_codon:yes stop_codon:yes gene_type:complete